MKELLIGLALAVTLTSCSNNTAEQTPAQTETPATQAETPVTEQTTSQSEAQTEELGKNDTEALQKAYGDNLAEIKMAELAQEKSGDEKVRELATHIEEDHETANQRLRAPGSTLSVDLSDDIPDEKEEIIDRLSGLNGEEFDQQYVSSQVELHQKALEFYQFQATSNPDSQLGTYFEQTAPALRGHLEAAQKL